MIKDIENIDTYETRTKVNKKKWRPIYEVIDEAYFKDSKISPDDFIKEFKNNSNEAQFIPRKEKKHKANSNGTRIICTSDHDTSKGFEICCNR